MPAPYSIDLRKSVIIALEKGNKNQTEISIIFNVSTSFVSTLWKHYNETKIFKPKKVGGNRKPIITEIGREHLREWIANDPSLTLDKLSQRYMEHFNVSVSKSTVGLTLQKMGMKKKKKPLRSSKRKPKSSRVKASIP